MEMSMETESTRVRVLIVEDDLTLRPIWQFILDRRGGDVDICWVKDVVTAERRITEALFEERPYDIVISDIFLRGSQTGLDLWRWHQDQQQGGRGGPRFLMTSVVSREKFHEWLGITEASLIPDYIQKPLDVEEGIRQLNRLWPFD